MSVIKDFQPPRDAGQGQVRRRNRNRLRLIGGGAMAVVVAVVLLLLGDGSGPQLEARETPVETPAPAAAPAVPPQPAREELRGVVEAGSSITALLGDYFSAGEIHELNRKSRDVFPFTKICAGQPYRIVTIDGRFDAFIYEIDSEEELVISRPDAEVEIARREIVYDLVVENVQGVIESSLFDAVGAIGEAPELAIILADIFGWDINFILDIRSGDSFQALVQKRFRDGKPAGYGHVLAAEFVNQGESFKAFRYEDGAKKVSYYNEKGENLRKAFLKAPLSFTRISSGYSLRRMHPIKKVWKSHPAIDYVAPPGTPIKTVGDGTVTRKGYTKGNGNFIEVTHSNGYSSIYLHMSGFSGKVKRGGRVVQGQVIGYVGQTGLATGPHLCFRMRRHGQPVNPLRLKVPSAKSIGKDQLAAYRAVMEPLLAQLEDGHRQSRIAKLQQDINGMPQSN